MNILIALALLILLLGLCRKKGVLGSDSRSAESEYTGQELDFSEEQDNSSDD